MLTLPLFTIVLIVHIGAAMLLVGGAIAASLVRQRVRAAGNAAELGAWLAFGAQAARFNPLLSFTVLGTALYMGSKGFWYSPWFWVAGVLWLADVVLAVAFVQRGAQAIGAALARAGGILSPEVEQARDRRLWDIGLVGLRANAAAFLYLMLAKPLTLSDGVTVVALSHAVSLALWGVEVLQKSYSRSLAGSLS